MHDILQQQFKEEVTRLGVKELRTPQDVDTVLATAGTTLVFVNSVCGCAGGVARPALALSLANQAKPDAVTTVFASADREATARARTYFTNMPPSSPSFAMLRDGKLVDMIHRSEIEISSPQEIAQRLKDLYDKYCVAVPQQ